MWLKREDHAHVKEIEDNEDEEDDVRILQIFCNG